MTRIILALFLLVVALPAYAQDGQKYTCPMHPHYISDDAGTCPICGMDLVPLETQGDDGPSQSEADKRTNVRIDPRVIQNIGVRTEAAELTEFGRQVRSYGLVTENTRLQTMISARVEGWIEELAVTAVGDTVEAGALLFRLYSPDLISAQQDFISALATGSEGRIDSASRRLRSLGLQNQAIAALRQNRRIFQQVPFYAETAGVVSALPVREGSFVKPGDDIAAVQDYSTVWVRASVAEMDLSLLETGKPARVFFPNLPGQTVNAAIDYIHPTIDPQTRTGQVRIVIENPNGVLRPGAYADVVFDVGSVQRLAVPSEAVLRDSSGSYVILALPGGVFEPRKVQTGLSAEGRTEIVSGLVAGDLIVASGQFLIDSESALRESFRKLQRVQMPLSLLDVDDTQLAMIDHLVDAALYIHEAQIDGYDLRADFFNPALEAKDALMRRFGETRLSPVLENGAAAIRAAQNARTRSQILDALNGLISALEPWLLNGKPQHYKEKGLSLFADHESGHKWLQQGSEPLNPYGAGPAHVIEWPDAPSADAPMPMDEDAAPSGGGHVH